MNRDHPNYAACIAWANGETIQYSYMEGPWKDWESDHDTPAFHSYHMRFRLKPKSSPVWFRTYLYQAIEGPRAGVTHTHDLKYYDPESADDFIRWLDPGWRELSY